MVDTTTPATETRAGFVAIIGAPNAGKSTLMNQLLGAKVAIVSPKVQTTRFNIRGVLTRDSVQFVFVDTPGIHRPRRSFDRAMVDAAWQSHADADVVLLLIDAYKGFNEEARMIIENLKADKATQNVPVLLAFNKIDKVPKEKLLPLMAEAGQLGLFRDVFAISALKRNGLGDILNKIAEYIPASPYLYDEDTLTDLPDRLLAAEITREKAFLLLGEELPYSLSVQTENWATRADGSIEIHQNLMIERDGQKKIVIGKGGQMLKEIGQRARKELQHLFECNVHLYLQVKVRPAWSEDRRLLEALGLAPSKGK